MLAAIRLAVSSLKPEYRLRVFGLRFLIAAFALAASGVVQVIVEGIYRTVLDQHTTGPKDLTHTFRSQFEMWVGAAALIFVMALGEHLIYADLARRKMLPEKAVRFPLAF